MAAARARQEEVEALLQRSDDLEDRFESWQQGSPPTSTEVRQTHRDYQAWYSQALALLSDEEDRGRFVDSYEGGVFTKRIRSYLTDPRAVNPFFREDEPNPLIPRWLHPFETTVRPSLAVQREVLVRTLRAVADVSGVLDELTAVCKRLPDFLSILRSSTRGEVRVPAIAAEADLQVVVHAILRLLFDDVRPEDPVPLHAGASSRVDFLLREAGVVVETKMTRAGLTDRRVGEELLVDWGRYPRHPDCRAILALVYDPDRRITNAAALEADLSQDGVTPATRVVVIR